MFRDLVEFFVEVMIPVVLTCTLIIGVAVGLVIYATKSGCQEYAQQTGRETKYSVTGGCFIKAQDNKWYTEKEFQATLVTKEK